MLTEVPSLIHTKKTDKAKTQAFSFYFWSPPCQLFASKPKSPYLFGALASVKQLIPNSSSWCSFHIVLLVWITTY